MLPRKVISLFIQRNIGKYYAVASICKERTLTCFAVSWSSSDFQNQQVVAKERRQFSISCARFPRSEHFKYIGDESKTPKELAVLAKRARKREKTKIARRAMKDDLENTLEVERLKEDIEDTIDMVRKRLNLKEKDIAKLHMNVDYLLSQKIPFTVISKMCNVAPKTIALNMTLLKKRISVFKVNSFFEESLVKIFKKNPKLLLRNVEDTLTVKVEAIRRLPFGFSVDEVVGILQRCPDMIEYLDTNNLMKKLRFLEEDIGFTKKQVRKILLKYPAVTTMNMTRVQEKVEFCTKKFNVDLEKIANYPRILHSKVDRLKERYEFLEGEGISGKDVKIRGWALKGIAANSDVCFAERIAQKPLKKLRDFQAKQRNSKLLEESSSP